MSIKRNITIVRYNDCVNLLENFINCDARLIWGGDKSIKEIRKFELNPSLEILHFADRFSLCDIRLLKILKLNQYVK